MWVSVTEEGSVGRVAEGSTDRVEEGSTDRVGDGSRDKVGDGSTEVAEGSTAVDSPGVLLERVTLPSNSASLRERSEFPSPAI